MAILIKNGRIIDPSAKLDKVGDLLIENGKISKVCGGGNSKTSETIDASGKIVVPGFVDMHTHLREPGREDKETIKTGCRAAVAGGFTTVCAMPNTDPACDAQAHVKFILEKAAEAGFARVLPIGSITKARLGKEMTEMQDLHDAGCLAVSDDGDSVADAGVMRRALEYASMVGLLVMSHCEDKRLVGDGVMHEGYWSTILGLKPIPVEAESTIVERDIQLAELAGARLHISHVSAAKSVEIIRQAKKRGARVTAEATPHHFTLRDEDLKGYNTNLKVNPPLRAAADIEAVMAGLKDGTIDAIATDHAPHLESEKEKEFDFAPFGMIGLETALSLAVMQLVEKGYLDWSGLVAKMATNPARILGLAAGSLAEGREADIAVIDPAKEWVYRKEEIVSRSTNSPFIGWKLKAKISDVLVGGKVVLREGKLLL
jgi:dihydroorotase